MTENCYVDKDKNGLSKPLIKTVEMKSILSVNRNKETKQTVYLCSECNMGYASKNLLKEHMIAVSEQYLNLLYYIPLRLWFKMFVTFNF